MKEIKLTQGKVALVDDEDFENLNQYKWCAEQQTATYYARRYAPTKNGQSTIRMHRLILQAPIGIQVDHINHNGLDNRRVNLRLCTLTQNQQNRKPRGGSSKFKGVHWFYDSKKNWGGWQARIKVNRKQISLGYFHEEKEAAMVYDNAANKYFGEFALTNQELGLY